MLDITKTRNNLGKIEVSNCLENLTRDISSAFDSSDEPLLVKQIFNGGVDFEVQECRDNAPIFRLKIVDRHFEVF